MKHLLRRLSILIPATALLATGLHACDSQIQNTASNNVSLIVSPTTNELYVFNLLNHRVTDQLQTGARPDDLAVSSDSRRVLVTNINDGSVSVFERLTGMDFIGRGRVNVQGTNPQGVAFNSIGNRAYVTTGDTSSIAILDTTNPSKLPNLIRSVRIPFNNNSTQRPSPAAIAVSLDNQRLFVVDKSNGTLLAFTQSQADNFALAEFFQPAAQSRVEFRDVVVGRDNRVYLVDSSNDQLLVFNASNIQQPVAQVSLRDGQYPVITPENIALGKGMSRLFITGSAANVISVVNNPTQLQGSLQISQVGQNIPINGSASRPATSPVGVDVTSNDQQVYVSNGGGGFNISLLEVSPTGQVVPARNFGTAVSAANAPPLGRMQIVFFNNTAAQSVRVRNVDDEASPSPAASASPAVASPTPEAPVTVETSAADTAAALAPHLPSLR
ncbi:MAG: hypothetical protein ACO1RX_17145 [Candidatus Sericytochromatia bacterium]